MSDDGTISVIMFIILAILVGFGVGYPIGSFEGYKDGMRYMIEESVDNNNVFEARQDHYRAECVVTERLEH